MIRIFLRMQNTQFFARMIADLHGNVKTVACKIMLFFLFWLTTQISLLEPRKKESFVLLTMVQVGQLPIMVYKPIMFQTLWQAIHISLLLRTREFFDQVTMEK